jgi:hypothetical protein
VSDFVFGDLNTLQASKIACEVNSEFGEAIWYYPSGSATEVDRYVVWNYRENHWATGTFARGCGVDRGVFLFPLRVAAGGTIYEHEVGFSYEGATPSSPYLESGPLELGSGKHTMDISAYVPDEKTAGGVTLTLKGRNYPNAAETSYGPFTAANPRSLRITARQLKVRYTGAGSADWRIGLPRLEVQAGSRR